MHLCSFVVSLAVALDAGTVFTNSNAASAEQKRGEGIDGLNLIKFEAIRCKPRPWDRSGWLRPVQAEVLVEECVPLKYVSRIAFVSEASKKYADRLWGESAHPSFEVEPSLFWDFRSGTGTLDFPHLRSFVLTDLSVDESNVKDIDEAVTVFDLTSTEETTGIASVKAHAGTSGEFVWDQSPEMTHFDKSTKYRHWSSAPEDMLAPGVHTVEYRLDGSTWALEEFEVTA